MSPQTSVVDTTFYETLPPQMVDLRHLPPMRSDSSETGRGEIGPDEAQDPLYPIETMQHDTDEGYKRWMAMKEKKKREVRGYVVVRSRHWEQVRTWDFVADSRTETWKFFTGSSESRSTEVTSSIELELGLSKGLFNGKLKSAFTFTRKDTATFSQSTEHSITTTLEGDCYYLFWQIVEDFDLYRITTANPAEPVYVKSFSGYTETQITNKFRKSDLTKAGGPGMPPFGAKAKVLGKGESYSVPTYVKGKTTFSFKNLSDQEKGQVTLSGWIGGIWNDPWVISIAPGYTKTERHAYSGDQVKITNSGAHKVEVWTG